MIGIFDSGSGGLTVLKALRLRAPQADIVYFGDIKNAPYGTRSAEELIALTGAGIRKLHALGADEIISACNSVAASVLAGAAGTTRLIDMTRPTARAMRQYAGKRVLLLATPATILSRTYTDALGVIVVLDPLHVEDLAGAIEFGASKSEIAKIVRKTLMTRENREYDRILLGCTHYPLARDVIEEEARKIFGAIDCIDPAEAVAEEAIERFSIRGDGKLQFHISQKSDQFRHYVAELFPGSERSITIV